MKNIVILGATSGIAEQAARLYAADACRLLLVARNASHLEEIAADLRVRGADHVHCLVSDLADVEAMPRLAADIAAQMPSVDALWIAHGTLPDEAACQRDPSLTAQTLIVNGLSPVLLVSHLLNQSGLTLSKLVVLSSVAGDTGRPSIATYGSAKAMLSYYLTAMHRAGSTDRTAVYLIKPGVVKTRMTAHLQHGLLSAEAPAVAAKIRRIVETRGPGSYYVPSIWWLVMMVVRHMPAMVLRRL